MCRRDELWMRYYDFWMDLKVKAIVEDYRGGGSLGTSLSFWNEKP